ncbi:MAG: SAM hydroxide adenosyltransferase [Weeksellaceae bacterium]
MKKLIVVADWASDSLTCQEVRSAVEGYVLDPSNPNITFVSSTPSTIHTSYLLAQIVEIEERFGRPLDTIIFQNTDPRIQTVDSVQEAKGAELIIVRLKSGLILLGPNAGYDFTMIKDKIDVVFHYPGLDKGSQFRSRDLYSRVSAHLMDSLEDDLDLEEAGVDLIPEFDGMYIGHIDNYGNIKTTITEEYMKESWKYGDTVQITINEVTQDVMYVDNLFGAKPGELVIYPGSSGVKENHFMEISVWRHFTEAEPTTGMHMFKSPRIGQEITFSDK